MRYCEICLTFLIVYASLGDACKPKEAIRHLDEALAEMREIDLDVAALTAVMANHERIERKLDLCLGKSEAESLKGKRYPKFGSQPKLGRPRFTRRPGKKILLLTKKYYKNQRPDRRFDVSSDEEK